MARRTVAIGLAEDRITRGVDIWGNDVPVDAWENIPAYPFQPDPREYVSILVDGSALERLLWREIKHIIKKARLTDWQEVVLYAHLNGLTIAEIGILYHIPKSSAQYRLESALTKVGNVPHKGLLTVMIEALGWPAVREHLADKLELRINGKVRTIRTN